MMNISPSSPGATYLQEKRRVMGLLDIAQLGLSDVIFQCSNKDQKVLKFVTFHITIGKALNE